MGTITKSIGTTGRDYSTLQSWEDALPANMVTDGNAQVGECYNDSEFSSAGVTLLISGITTDATNKITLTTAAGQSFRDHASVQTNALRYNASNGVAIKTTANYVAAVEVQVNYTTISKLQIAGANGVSASRGLHIGFPTTNCIAEFCIVEGSTGSNNDVGVLAHYEPTGITRNCLIIQRLSGSAGIMAVGNGGSVYNCTVVAPSDLASAPTNAVFNTYGTPLFKNCAFFGAANVRSSASGTWTTCMSDATGFTGCTGGKTYANQFQNTTAAAADFRAKALADLLDAGTTDATHAANDIAGTARPSGSAYDIGCWELAAGTVFNQSVLASSSPAPALLRQTGKPLATTSALVATLSRSTAKPQSATTAPLATLTRQTAKPLQTTTTPVPTLSLLKVFLKSLQATTAPVASLVRQTAKAVAVSTAPAASLVRSTSKALATSTAPVATLSAIRVFLKTVQASADVVPTVTRAIGKPIAAIASVVPTVVRLTSKTISAVTSPVATIVRATSKAIAAVTSPIPTLTAARAFFVSLLATANAVATVATQFVPAALLVPIASYIIRVTVGRGDMTVTRGVPDVEVDVP